MKAEKVEAPRKVRVLRIEVDGQTRTEAARERTALEVQHELRLMGLSVRVTERYI